MTEFSSPVAARMDHLVELVRRHNKDHGSPGAESEFTVVWEPGGWWVSVVMPGHYAFENQVMRPNLGAALAEAVAYYGEMCPLWGEQGCQEHHPFVEAP